jgi:hypothetical protein
MITFMELERIWKEEVLAYLNAVYQHSMGMTEEKQTPKSK